MKFKDQIFDCDIYVNIGGEAQQRDYSISQKKYGDNHHLCSEELELLLTDDVEALVVGTGQHGVLKITNDAHELIEKKQLELHALETPAAIKKYNEICAARKTVAFIHVTC